MAREMHAVVVEQFGKRPGQTLVKTEACGVRRTDLHAAHGGWPVRPIDVAGNAS